MIDFDFGDFSDLSVIQYGTSRLSSFNTKVVKAKHSTTGNPCFNISYDGKQRCDVTGITKEWDDPISPFCPAGLYCNIHDGYCHVDHSLIDTDKCKYNPSDGTWYPSDQSDDPDAPLIEG